MKPDNIRCGLTILGNIEAAITVAGTIRRVVIDGRTGDVIEFNVGRDTDLFRWLVREARAALRDRQLPPEAFQ